MMIILNYQLSLPQAFDMSALRERLPSVGRRFDHNPGLGAKAFLFREKGVHGSPVNQYAPFYLFADDEAAPEFLWGGEELTGVVGAYGRPTGQIWIGGGYYRGPALGETPSWAVRTVARVPVDEAPAGTAAQAHAELSQRVTEPGLHSAAFGIDPRNWELLTFTMHTTRPDPRGGELYEVIHLSAPAEADLRGR